MIDEEQRLLAKVLDLFCEEFGPSAVLRGGMVLKLLGSTRYTNDLDYIFVPFKSKKDILSPILEVLEKIENSEIKHSLNSQCLRIVLRVEQSQIQIEVKTALNTKTTVATTKILAQELDLPKRLVTVVDHSIALANKLAAWNERRLIRDIYDICFFLQMNVSPDTKTLEQRLKTPHYSSLVKEEDHYNGKSTAEFYQFLRDQTALLSPQDIKEQLSDYLPPEELKGLSNFFRGILVRLK